MPWNFLHKDADENNKEIKCKQTQPHVFNPVVSAEWNLFFLFSVAFYIFVVFLNFKVINKSGEKPLRWNKAQFTIFWQL